MTIVIALHGHTSQETAYVVNDYPYGFRLRCKIRYWIEYKPSHGFRFVSQTTNPKVPGERWNKPKAGQYVKLAMGMFLNEEGHVSHTGLSGYELEPFLPFLQHWHDKNIVDNVYAFTLAKLVHVMAVAKVHAQGLSAWRINGVAEPVRPTEIEDNLKDMEQLKLLIPRINELAPQYGLKPITLKE